MITGTLKEITIGGLSSTPSDYGCQDGDMMVYHNMVGGKAVGKASTVKVGEGADAQELPDMGADARLVFVHNTSFGKVYIINDGGVLKRNRNDADEDSAWIPLSIDAVFNPETDSITHMDNVLIVNFRSGDLSGLNYLRYKPEDRGFNYFYLGQNPPDINGVFTLGDTTEKIEPPSTQYGSETFSDDIQCCYCYTIEENGTDFVGSDNWSEGKYNDPAFASINRVMAQAAKRNLYVLPFFARYAYRMYDGNYIMHSSPVMLLPTDTTDIPLYLFLDSDDTDVYIDGYSRALNIKVENHAEHEFKSKYHKLYSLCLYKLKTLCFKASHTLGDWKDIVQSVDVFITPYMWKNVNTGDIKKEYMKNSQAEEFEEIIKISNRTIKLHCTKGANFLAKINLPEKGGGVLDFAENSLNTFRLVKSYNLEDIPTSITQVTHDGGIENLNTFEQLIDGYAVRRLYKPNFLHSYNNRLNIANVDYRELPTMPSGFLNAGAESGNNEAWVYIEEDGQWQIVKSKTDKATYQTSDWNGFFYYPNPNAKYLKLGSYWIALKPHPFLNGAYYLNENLKGMDYTTTRPSEVPADSRIPDNTLFHKPNWLVTSEVDNPFIFPTLGVNQIGSGKIKAIKSATQAMSEGTAFGAQPLYVFTEDGIFAMQVNGVGLYDRAAPLSRETITDASKVLSIDNSILFLNERGLMELRGSSTKCLSLPLTDKWSSVDLGKLKNWELIDAEIGETDGETSGTVAKAYGEASEFKDFIKNAKMAFDYVNYRVYVYADGVDYAYVYDIGSKQWSTAKSDMKSSVEGYPATYINMKAYNDAGEVKGTRICQFGDDDEPIDGGRTIWLTRPMKFDEHDILKTVRRVMMRGRFSQKDSLKLALWGSRNLEDWVYIGGVKEGVQIPRLSGTPYKYFVVGGCATMSNEDMLSRLTVEKSERYVNKPR